MITITVSGPPKSGKTIIGNLIAEYLDNLGLDGEKTNFEDKYLTDDDVLIALGSCEIEIVEHIERDDRTNQEEWGY